MAFQAILKIEDKEYNVISFNYKSMRDHDRSGRPTSIVYNCKIEMVLEHSPNCVLLHQWAYQNHEVKNGTITFMRRDNYQKQTEIVFSDGYIVDLATRFTNVGDEPMTESVVISARTFEISSQGIQAKYDLEWPVA